MSSLYFHTIHGKPAYYDGKHLSLLPKSPSHRRVGDDCFFRTIEEIEREQSLSVEFHVGEYGCCPDNVRSTYGKVEIYVSSQPTTLPVQDSESLPESTYPFGNMVFNGVEWRERTAC